jgi:hypothetical protein
VGVGIEKVTGALPDPERMAAGSELGFQSTLAPVFVGRTDRRVGATSRPALDDAAGEDLRLWLGARVSSQDADEVARRRSLDGRTS